ncbi:MAG TPA: ABC transporter substrate-binding protein [Stellaceae bacterium]|nr:ABC transporter substrate-binding protein [Stellaceae bacterium]
MSQWTPTFTPDGRLALSLAISEYDHVRDLATGIVRPQGIAVNVLSFAVEEIFHRFTRYREWEVSEMSMGKYSSLVSQGDTSVAAIPVFPSRVFRHSSIYVRKGGSVRAPQDLRGKRVGLPEWAQTAAVYTRGMLVHEYGVKLNEVEWVQAGVDEPGRVEKVELKLPPGVRVTPRPDSSLDRMLRAGEIDAAMSAHAPPSFEAGNADIVRLFPDYRGVEEAYFRKTGIYPIMHVIALRSEVLARFPWVATNLMEAFEAAKVRSLARSREITASRFPVPWIADIADRAAELFDGDPMPYGIAANRTTLAAYLRFAHEQGVCHKLLEPEDLFPPEVRTAFKV